MKQSDPVFAPDAAQRRTGYVVKVYPRFSETFIVTEILAREEAGEELEIFALRPTTDTRFHPQIARVQAPVHHIPKPYKLADGWSLLARAAEVVPGFAQRCAALLPELARYEAADVHQAIALACAASERGITHLHAHFGSLAGRTAELAAQLCGIEYSVTTHAKDLFHESVDPVRLGRTIARAHHIVTISDYNLRHLRARYPESADRIRLVYNGVELDRFPFAPPRPLAPVSAGPLRVAAVGRIVEKKGFFDLVTAAGLLRERGIDVQVRIAGEGELQDELARAVTETGLEEHVTLLGARTQQEVRELLEWADVFAAPSIVGTDGNADGLPTVLLEAMATGVPCAASRVTGIPEAIIHGETGLLHDPGDVEGLVSALAAAADPSFDRAGIAAAARSLIEARFDSRRQARLLAQLEDAPARPERELEGLRVAYVSVDPGVPVHGTKGASVHVQEVVRELVRRGAQVTLFTTRTGDVPPQDLAAVELVHLPLVARTDAQRETAQQEASAAFASQIIRGGFDLVYERCSLFSTVIAQTAEAGIPGILEVNAPLIDEQRTHRVLIDEAAARTALQRQVEAAVRTIAVSQPVAQWTARAVGAESPQAADVRVVPNGVDVARISPRGGSAEDEQSGSRRHHRPGEGHSTVQVQTRRAVRVAFVGTLKPWHGVEDLVDAAAQSEEDWELLIVGDGPQGEALRDRAARAGLGSRIEFTGAVSPSEIGDLLADCDIAAAPYPAASAEDSYFSPLKVFEYLAAGLPVVASAIGQLPAVLEGTDAGILVPPSDPAALAAALDALAADPDARQRMGAAARRRAVSHHSWSAAVDQILDGVPVGGTELSRPTCSCAVHGRTAQSSLPVPAPVSI